MPKMKQAVEVKREVDSLVRLLRTCLRTIDDGLSPHIKGDNTSASDDTGFRAGQP